MNSAAVTSGKVIMSLNQTDFVYFGYSELADSFIMIFTMYGQKIDTFV
jgi:hypothetical protein